MFRNMATSLVTHERIETTLHKAKELRSIADHMITLGKRGDLHARRQALSFIRSPLVVDKIFSDLALRFKERNGGYTRVLHLGERAGDSAPMALIEYLPGAGAAEGGEPEAGQGKKKPATRQAAVKKSPKGPAPKAEKKEPKKAEVKADKKTEKEALKAKKKEEKAKRKEEKAKKKEEKKAAKKEARKKSK